MKFFKTHKVPVSVALITAVLYFVFAYNLERSDFIKLISLCGALFIITYFIIEKLKFNFWVLAVLGIAFRIVFIAAIPNLSQDFYRFLWDGRLVIQGISPYLFTPENVINNPSAALGATVPQAQQLYEGMGALNASHFSNYPPINQFFFAIAALFAGKSILGSVIVLRLLIVLADVGILYFGKKILEQLKIPIKHIFWYFLNPFIIIELTGNLHFEGVMLFFFAAALYLLFKGRWLWAAALLGISVSVKLIPLLFLPLFFKYFLTEKVSAATEWKRLLKFYSAIAITVCLTLLPFLSSEFIQNFSATIALWFQNFEFNASVYYIVRWIGFQIVGWNIIGIVGKVFPFIVLLFVLWLSFIRKNKLPQQLLVSMLFAVSFYLLLSTTVHPWYVATPLLLSVFTKYRFPIVWSFMVMLSYAAYGPDGFNENLWLVCIEYSVVIGVTIWEIFYRPKLKHSL